MLPVSVTPRQGSDGVARVPPTVSTVNGRPVTPTRSVSRGAPGSRGGTMRRVSEVFDCWFE